VWGSQGGAVQVDPGFSQLTPRLLSTLETKILYTAFKYCFQLQPAPLHQGLEANTRIEKGEHTCGRAVQVDPTGARAKAWCLLIHADASLSLSQVDPRLTPD